MWLVESAVYALAFCIAVFALVPFKKDSIFKTMKQHSVFFLALLLLAILQAKSQATKDTLISIYFSTNAYELDSVQSVQLAAIAASVTSVKQVTGYADSRGSKPFNLQLS